MSIIKDSKFECATYFCVWFYQTKRGNIKRDSNRITEAIEIYISLFEDFTIAEQEELRKELILLVKKTSSCIDRLKEKWLHIGKRLNHILDEFRTNDELGLSEEERDNIIDNCYSVFLTSTIFFDESAFTKFIQKYYDLGKRTEEENKISNYDAKNEEHILWLIEKYLFIQTHLDQVHTEMGYILPKKKDITHLAFYFAKVRYKRDNMQAIFKTIFGKDISFSKADKLQEEEIII